MYLASLAQDFVIVLIPYTGTGFDISHMYNLYAPKFAYRISSMEVATMWFVGDSELQRLIVWFCDRLVAGNQL